MKKLLKFKSKTGFTLMELLAAIAIMGILLVLVVPNILKTYEKAQIEAFKTNVKSIARTIDNYIFKNDINNFPLEGINLKDLDITNKQTYSGKYIKNEKGNIEADNVSNGIYCAKGEIESLVVAKGCENLDATAPMNLVLVITNTTASSMTVVGDAVDNESGIIKYEFKIDGNGYIDNDTSNTYKFTGLITGNHVVYMRVTNGKGMTSEINTEGSLTELVSPTYIINPSGWSTSKTVTINYPQREEGYTYSYSKDEGSTWVTVESGVTADILFNINGTLIGKVSDGINFVTSSQTVSQIDNVAPNIGSVISEITNSLPTEFTITRTGDAIDNDSGLQNNPYIYQVSTDNTNWITKCTNNTSNCIINGTNFETTYYYRICAIDNAGNQSCISSKTKIGIDENYCKSNSCPLLSQKILDDNNETADTAINFGAISSSSNGRGLYYRTANNETNCVSGNITYVSSGVCRSYYYRGSVANNYVYFAGSYWRIIRINEDGSIRMIYAGILPTSSAVDATIGDSIYTNSLAEYLIGYMYNTSGTQTAMTTSSTSSIIKQSVDTWYSNNLNSYSSYISKNTIFCNDRQNLGTTANGNFRFVSFGGDGRLYTNKTPKLICTQANDKLVSTASTSTGMKVMTYPVGLITADEVAFAGGLYETGNSDYYLNIGKDFYTMTPINYTYTTTLGPYAVYIYAAGQDGSLHGNAGKLQNLLTWSYGVRPVISLKSCVKTIGSGTTSDPYRAFLDLTCPSSAY